MAGALTGVMTADFTQFTTEVDRSVVKLQELERAGTGTSDSMSGMADGLSQVDKTLGLFGVRIGPQIAALRELGNVAGLTVSQLGAVGTAGALVAAGVAGWNIGAWIADWTGLNNAIKITIDELSGLNAQTAGAKLDLMARASQIAGKEITSYGAAVAIVRRHNQDLAESLNTGSARLRQWGEDIAKVKKSGDWETIVKELKEGSSTVKQLAERFHISAEAITYYTNRAKESSTILENLREKERADLKKVTDAQTELNQAGGGWRDTLLTIAPAAAATATQYIAMGQNLTTIATATRLSEIQVQALDKAYKEQIATLARLEPATQSLDTWMRTAGKQFQVAAESGDQFKTMLELTAGMIETQTVPQIEKLEETYRSLTTAIREETSKNAPGSVGVNLGGMSFGTAGVEAAMAAYTARFGSGSAAGAIGGGPAPDFLSWAMKMGYATKGTQVSNTFNIVDTESEIARRVADEISRQIQRGSLVQ